MTRETIFKATTRFGILLFALSLPISHVPAQFAIGIAFLGWLGEGLVNRKWSVHWHPAFVPLIVYLAWNALSAALSERPGHSLGAVLDNEWSVFIMLMLYWTIDESAFLKKTMMVFLSSACIAVAYAVWQVVGGVELYRHMMLDLMGSGLYRAVGFYSFYLTFAAFAMAAFFFSASFSFEFRKWYFVVLSALSFLAVIGSFCPKHLAFVRGGDPAIRLHAQPKIRNDPDLVIPCPCGRGDADGTDASTPRWIHSGPGAK